MAYTTKTRTGHRFLGNKNTKEVHDLEKEDTSGSGCQIDEILRADNAVYFIPDTLAQAKSENYDNCAKCLGSSRR